MADGPIQFQAPQPITIGASGVQNLSGAANATLILGAGLVAVSLWQDVLTPLWESAWNGAPLKITLPAGLALGEVLFVGALVFLTSVAPEWAPVTVWFVLGLWVVWIINNGPTVVSAFSYLTTGVSSAGSTASSGASSTGGSWTYTHPGPVAPESGATPALPTHNL